MQFKYIATGVGSLPHTEVVAGCELALSCCPQGPFWPTLPKADFRENMYVQFSEGLPRVQLDPERQRVVFDCDGDLTEDLTAFYEKVLADDVDSFACGEEYARGLYYMMDALADFGEERQFVKGQVTGPFSFGLTATDTHNRPILFNDEMADAIVQGVAMKARWQVRKLSELGLPVVVFIDEPYFASLGSAYVPIGREQAVPMLQTVVSAIHQEEGICGVHCCGNTDWSAVIETGTDIMNFDAYAYFEGVSLYGEQVRTFLERGGTLAWGIVPTDENVLRETPDLLCARLDGCVESLVARGIPEELLRISMILTSSCGLAPAEVQAAERALRLTAELAEIARPAHCGVK